MSSTKQDIKAVCRWTGRPGLLPALTGLVLVGVAAFVGGVLGANPLRAWQAYLINLVFWTGLAAGAVLFSAIQSITHAFWGRPLKRLAEAPGTFLMIAPLLFLVLYAGRGHLFPWIAHPVPGKEIWLNVPFLFLRDGIGLLLLGAAAFNLIRLSVRRETDPAATPLSLATDTGGREEGVVMVFANIYAILCAVVLSLIAFDLIMSLSPHWYSTLFGAYYFIGSFYMALAALMLLACLAVRKEGMGRYIEALQFQNLGKLMLGFALLTGDFFFTQFLVIWYGNLPEETAFVILRTQFAPWRSLAWTVLAVCFVLPFVVLLSRRIKLRPWAMFTLGSVILIGMWLEKFLLVVPSLWQGQGLPLGVSEVSISLGFFGVMALCIATFLKKFPILPFADPLLRVEKEGQGIDEEVKR